MPEETSPLLDNEKVREHLNALTPERAESVASVIAEEWRRDWGAILELLVTKTGLSRSDAFQYLMLRELAQVRFGVEKGIQPKYHLDCAACQSEKRFHEMQLEVMELTLKDLKEGQGGDWKP